MQGSNKLGFVLGFIVCIGFPFFVACNDGGRERSFLQGEGVDPVQDVLRV